MTDRNDDDSEQPERAPVEIEPDRDLLTTDERGAYPNIEKKDRDAER